MSILAIPGICLARGKLIKAAGAVCLPASTAKPLTAAGEAPRHMKEKKKNPLSPRETSATLSAKLYYPSYCFVFFSCDGAKSGIDL